MMCSNKIASVAVLLIMSVSSVTSGLTNKVSVMKSARYVTIDPIKVKSYIRFCRFQRTGLYEALISTFGRGVGDVYVCKRRLLFVELLKLP